MPDPIGAIDAHYIATLAPAYGVIGLLKNVAYDNYYKPAQTPSVAGVDVDLYTCPAGKRMGLVNSMFNPGISPILVAYELKRSGVYYRVGGVGTRASNVGTVSNPTVLAEAGETIALNISRAALVLTQVAVAGAVTTYTGTITGGATNAFTGIVFNITGFATGGNNVTGAVCTGSSTTTLTFTTSTQSNEVHAGAALEQTGLNILGSAYTFDTSSPLRTIAITSFVSGVNTIYTCPANKVAIVAQVTAALLGGYFIYNNQSGSPAITQTNIVPSGQSQVTGNLIQKDTVADGATISPGGTAFLLKAGDAILFNTNQTGKQIYVINILEKAG